VSRLTSDVIAVFIVAFAVAFFISGSLAIAVVLGSARLKRNREREEAGRRAAGDPGSEEEAAS
jgi:hypothetical protein